MKKRFLHILPHCSTGGSCTFALKRIESLKEQYTIKVVEYQNLSDHFVVQKNLIKALLPKENYVTLGHDKGELLKIINDFDPDIIFFEEIPELFCDSDLARSIYAKSDRKYTIIESTHNSEFDPIKQKIFLPDQFVFVSSYSKIRYSSLNVPSDIIEFPVDYKRITEEDKLKAKRNLNLSPDYKHIIVTGLFTERKNQKLAFQLARQLLDQPIQFHFLGNLADNFKYYWEPLLQDKPSNCIIHGESNRVNEFLKAGDLFLFPSLGSNHDRELHPIAIKEALSYNLRVLLFPLDVYLNKYDNDPQVYFLESSLHQNVNKIISLLGLSRKSGQAIAEILNTYLDTFYSREDNKVFISSNYSAALEFDACSIKEIDSNVPIYFWENITIHPNGNIWAIPINNYDFHNDSFCNGFLVELHLDNKSVYKKEIRFKPNTSFKNRMDNITPFDCLYINYREFFHTDIYKDLIDTTNLKTVIDVGANVGLFSYYILSKGAEQVFSLEPDPKAFKTLSQFLNDKPVKLHNVALSDHVGEESFSSDPKNTTISRLGEGNITVKTTTWSEFVKNNNIQKISLLKMDIESHEYAVFKTITNEHLKQIDQILLEFHENYNNELFDIINKLEEAGFRLTYKKQSSTENAQPTDNKGLLIARK